MDPLMVILIMFGSLILLLILGVPLAFAFGTISLVMTLITWNFSTLFSYVVTIYSAIQSSTFIAIPLFVAIGIVLETSGIAEDLFEAMHIFSGKLRGGLAIGTVVICMIFAAISGMAGTAAITMGYIALPAMLKRGYNKHIAMGSILGPTTLGILIPPSVFMIILAIFGEISVGRLFIAGVAPGIMLGAMFIGYIIFKGLKDPDSLPTSDVRYTFIEKIKSTKHLILPVFIIIGILGSIFSGAATPTEAAAVGLLGVFIAAAIKGNFSLKIVVNTATTIFKMVAMLMFLLFNAMAFLATFRGLGGTQYIIDLLLGLSISPKAILVVALVISFILGCFIDAGGIMMIIAPIVYPVIKACEIDAIWFSVVFIVVLMCGYITPPFGFSIFYLKSVAPPGITLSDIYKSVWPGVVILVTGTIMFFLFPQIITWLPSLLAGVQ